MSRTHFFISVGVLILLSSCLTACSALATPRQIASYPLDTPDPPPGVARVYEIYLELEAPDVDEAANSAIQMTYQVGGLLMKSHSWQQEANKHTTLVIAVPAARSEAFKWALLGLGIPIHDVLSSQIISRSADSPNTYVYFTVHLQPRRGMLSTFPPTGWHPMRTLVKAWSVSVSIFSFLVDILIWITFVPGPFIMIGVGVLYIIQRCRSKRVNRM